MSWLVKVHHSVARYKIGRVAYDGSTLIAIYPGETPYMATISLTTYLQCSVNIAALLKDIQNKIAFLHARRLLVGPEHLSPENILVTEPNEGPDANIYNLYRIKLLVKVKIYSRNTSVQMSSFPI